MIRAIRTGVAAALMLLASAAQAFPYTELAVFGDSLADSGNNAAIFDFVVGPSMTPAVPPGTLRTPTPIGSPASFPTYPYASNRYSNGPVWVEQLAGDLGLSATPSSFGGTNFAFGGARTGPANSPFPFSLLDQVSMFLSATGGVAPSDWLYVVVGGGNDLRDALLPGANVPQIVNAYATNIGTILAQLTGAGADQILLANVPDGGKTPAARAAGPLEAAGATFIAALMNQALAGVLQGLSPQARDGIDVLDTFGLFDQVFADPGIDAKSTCAFTQACIDNPGNTFFWDGIHPTTFGHRLLADAALRAIPEPSSVLLVALALVLLVARRRAEGPRCA
jgi:phospholipase/lecithinase/hemolysin